MGNIPEEDRARKPDVPASPAVPAGSHAKKRIAQREAPKKDSKTLLWVLLVAAALALVGAAFYFT